MRKPRKWSMATLLLGGTALILLLVVAVVGISLYRSTRQTIQSGVVAQYDQVFDQLSRQLTGSIRRVMQLAASINNNTELIGLVSLAQRAESPVARAEADKSIKSILRTAVGYQPFIDNVGLYLPGRQFMMYDTESAEYLVGIPAEPWFQPILDGDASEVLLPNHQLKKNVFDAAGRAYYRPYFLYARAFNDTLVSRQRGVLLISLEQTYLSSLLGELGGADALVALLDADGGLIFSQGEVGEGALLALAGGMDSLQTGDILPVGQRGHFLIRQGVDAFGWTLMALIPEDVMYHDLWALQVRILTVALAALLLGLLMIALISRSITRPFRQLMRSMDRAGDGDLQRSHVNSPIAEIDQLAAQYDAMLSRIASLIDRVRVAEQEKRQSEMAALKTQINPHFTYNTLDSIRWMALLQNAPRAADMISALVKLLKLTTGQRGEFAPVEREIEQVALYCEIIKFRYACQIDVIFDVEPNVRGARTLGMLLQPIVENSFVHGYDNFEGEGVIRVSARAQGSSLVFEVKDDGRGMQNPDGALPEISRKTGAHLHTGIGVSNVNSRVKAWFGDAYGVAFRSEPGVGTTVTLTQPLAIYEEVNE